VTTPDRERAVVAYADGVDTACIAPTEVAALARLDRPELLLGWTPQDRAWLDDLGLRGATTMGGYCLSEAIRAGRIRYLPVRLSAVPTLLTSTHPDVAVVTGVRRGAALAFGCSVGWGPAAARAARSVVIEVDEQAEDLGGPVIEGAIDHVVSRAPGVAPAVPTPPRAPDDVDRAIGRAVAALLPDDATIQLGPGGIAEAIVAGIDRPVRVWSGLITEATAELAGRGLLRGVATGGYVWGGKAIVELARAGRLRLAPVEETHDLTRVSAIERFVACNTALQVGLDGSVNVERVGGRVVAGIGGHADFAAAGSRSRGGMSVVALRSTRPRGGSTIVPRVEVVSTPRCDIDVVVTEHGVADLRGADDDERVERLVRVAAPEHRGGLLSAVA
jgi:acyl-CoA hydrolase